MPRTHPPPNVLAALLLAALLLSGLVRIWRLDGTP
jgi:hypothetical protein